MRHTLTHERHQIFKNRPFSICSCDGSRPCFHIIACRYLDAIFTLFLWSSIAAIVGVDGGKGMGEGRQDCLGADTNAQVLMLHWPRRGHKDIESEL
jgi:hypothetical protein